MTRWVGLSSVSIMSTVSAMATDIQIERALTRNRRAKERMEKAAAEQRAAITAAMNLSTSGDRMAEQLREIWGWKTRQTVYTHRD